MSLHKIAVASSSSKWCYFFVFLSSFFVFFVVVTFTAFGTNTVVIIGEESQCFGMRTSQSNPTWLAGPPLTSQNKSYANPGKGNGQNEAQAGKTTWNRRLLYSRKNCLHLKLLYSAGGPCSWLSECRTTAGWGDVDWTSMIGAHTQSKWWTVFPRCRTFDMQMTTSLSSPSCCSCLIHPHADSKDALYVNAYVYTIINWSKEKLRTI